MFPFYFLLVAESREKLRILVIELGRKCPNMRLKVNPAKSKVMRIGGGMRRCGRKDEGVLQWEEGNLRRWINSNI